MLRDFRTMLGGFRTMLGGFRTIWVVTEIINLIISLGERTDEHVIIKRGILVALFERTDGSRRCPSKDGILRVCRLLMFPSKCGLELAKLNSIDFPQRLVRVANPRILDRSSRAVTRAKGKGIHLQLLSLCGFRSGSSDLVPTHHTVAFRSGKVETRARELALPGFRD